MLQYLSFTNILFFISFVFFLTRWIIPSSITNKQLPPSPTKLPILGNLHQLGLYPHRSLQALAQRYGPLMHLHFGRKPVLIISSADAAAEITKKHDLIFSNRPKSTMYERLLYCRRDVATAPYGEYWRQMRSICVLHLLSKTRVQSFASMRDEEVAVFIKDIESLAILSLPMNLSQMFSKLANDVICRAAFGRKYSGGEGGRNFKTLLGELSDLLSGFNVADFIPWLGWVNRFNGVAAKVEKVAKEFDEFLDEVVEDHKLKAQKIENKSFGNEGAKDLLDVLLEIQKDEVAAGFSLETLSIKALILDMFAGGTDTTYTFLEWAMTELLRHPKVLKKLQNEVRGIANGQDIIKAVDLDKMHYLKAVLKETLRLHPPIPLLVPRESTQDVKIKEYDISAGTTVITNAWAIGRDPTLWEEPEEFRPERFLNSSIDFKGLDFQLIPFGAGRRGCPGILFAMATSEIVLANLVNKFDWSLPVEAKVEDLDMTEGTGLIIHRKFPLLAVATPSSC